MDNIIIREIKEEEYFRLEDMLYEAIFQQENTPLLSRDIIKNPDVYIYIEDFGTKADDYCLVAEIDSEIVGAVWIRILDGHIKGYGNIDSSTPEFSISLYKQYRNNGYGTMMMQRMIRYMKSEGYKQASLSANKKNYAVDMYFKLGFRVIQEREHDYLMLLNLNDNTQQ